jgi:hypothetical protein
MFSIVRGALQVAGGSNVKIGHLTMPISGGFINFQPVILYGLLQWMAHPRLGFTSVYVQCMYHIIVRETSSFAMI